MTALPQTVHLELDLETVTIHLDAGDDADSATLTAEQARHLARNLDALADLIDPPPPPPPTLADYRGRATITIGPEER